MAFFGRPHNKYPKPVNCLGLCIILLPSFRSSENPQAFEKSFHFNMQEAGRKSQEK